MIDLGLVSLFAIQAGLVMLTYHAWKGIKAEISALEALRQGNTAVTSRIEALSTKFDTLLERVSAVEGAPKAAKARMDEVDGALAKIDRTLDTLETKMVSLGARVSAFAKGRKAVKDEEETAPAPEGEGEQIPLGFMPPGAIPLRQDPPSAGLPPGFGVVGRRVRHG